jgi:hypothetical protein
MRVLSLLIISISCLPLSAQILDVEGSLGISGGLNFSGFSTNTDNDYELLLPNILISSGDVDTGLLVSFLVSATNTGSSTLAVNNGNTTSTPRNLLRRGNLHLTADDLTTGEIAMAIFNGSDWQLIHPAANLPEYLTNCGGQYVNLMTDLEHCGACDTLCPPGQRCVNGLCEVSCPAGQIECDGACVDINTDHNHCGSCGSPCADGEKCESGSCQTDCQDGLDDCTGQCANLMSDNNNCGTCGTVCPSGEKCVDGGCVTCN